MLNVNEDFNEAKITLLHEIFNVIDEISDKNYGIERKTDDLYKLKYMLRKLENKLYDLAEEMIETIEFDKEHNTHDELLKEIEKDLNDLKREIDYLVIYD